MYHHQEQSTNREAVVEHEGEQPGTAKLKEFVLLPADGQAECRQESAEDHEKDR